MSEKIDRFVGDFAFLSNFFPSTIYVDGRAYSTVEHAYQAAKTSDQFEAEIVRSAATPAQAKRLGRCVTLREGWNDMRIDVMRHLVQEKFTTNPILSELLLATGDAELIEGNHWNDRFFGVCRGEGENWLGRILMDVRAGLQRERSEDLEDGRKENDLER